MTITDKSLFRVLLSYVMSSNQGNITGFYRPDRPELSPFYTIVSDHLLNSSGCILCNQWANLCIAVINLFGPGTIFDCRFFCTSETMYNKNISVK